MQTHYTCCGSLLIPCLILSLCCNMLFALIHPPVILHLGCSYFFLIKNDAEEKNDADNNIILSPGVSI